jgi:hypothetical protein
MDSTQELPQPSMHGFKGCGSSASCALLYMYTSIYQNIQLELSVQFTTKLCGFLRKAWAFSSWILYVSYTCPTRHVYNNLQTWERSGYSLCTVSRSLKMLVTSTESGRWPDRLATFFSSAYTFQPHRWYLTGFCTIHASSFQGNMLQSNSPVVQSNTVTHETLCLLQGECANLHCHRENRYGAAHVPVAEDMDRRSAKASNLPLHPL